jgi:hypothetical protein
VRVSQTRDEAIEISQVFRLTDHSAESITKIVPDKWNDSIQQENRSIYRVVCFAEVNFFDYEKALRLRVFRLIHLRASFSSSLPERRRV